MKRSLRCLFLMVLMGLGHMAMAQTSGIAGQVKNDRGEEVINASVTVYEGGIQRAGTITDFEGNYEIRPLNPGRYEVRFSYLRNQHNYTDVIVSPGVVTTLNAVIETTAKIAGVDTGGIIVRATRYTKPLVNPRAPGVAHTLTSEEIEKLPTLNTLAAASTGTGSYTNASGQLQLGGGRASGTKVIIDGMQLNPGEVGFTNLPPGSVDQIQTLTGGLPARYGDASGGVVNIVTKGVTATTRGGIWLEQSIDGYDNKQGSFNLSGPLLRKKDSLGNKRPVLGYALNGSASLNKDLNPTYYPTYVVKDDKLAEIQEHPIVLIPSNSGGLPSMGYAAEQLRREDLTTSKRRINADQFTARLNGKLDYQLTDNINLTLGGFYGYNKYKSYNRNLALFRNEPFTVNSNTLRSYLRFTQRFGKTGGGDENGISNASYTIQADYMRDELHANDPRHGENPFRYGYVGKFTQRLRDVYVPGFTDTLTGVTGMARFYVFDGVDFTPSDINPQLATYTKEYFRLTPIQPTTLTNISTGGGRGLLNGSFPSTVYSIYSNIGASPSGFQKSLNEQVAVTVDASFDLKQNRITHSFEVGLYYQQRTERYYNLAASSLWPLMRQLTNGNFSPDQSNPHFVVDGTVYDASDVLSGAIMPGYTDTILYGFTPQPGVFSQNVRRKLGLDPNGGDYVQIDEQDPDFYSLDMFSADELLNGGSNLVSYYGYDYKGNLQTGSVNFNDFFTKRDANGNFTRPIAPFRPNYIAGYISDYIQYKNFKLSLGVRAERFDLNTKVLKDPYSLYATKTVADLEPGKYTVPGNMGSDYVVYVASNSGSSREIVGYRHGDDWYDPRGNFVEDPRSLKIDPTDPTRTTGLEPYLQNNIRITDTAFDPNSSFTDYKPQVNIMPRINFSFPISDVALFYAHYDVVVQRPTTGYTASPIDYYFFSNRANATIGNPDLKPEKLIDYEVGFQQKLSSNSALTLTGFYKERKDQIQQRSYLEAWPQTYTTYGNRDFSVSKGFTALYDLRRFNHLTLNLAYTLQFVEGTGSNENVAGRDQGLLSNFVAERVPNMRTVFPLDNDARHIINLNADYRYFDGEGPTIGGVHFLENAGINLLFRTTSGAPYTRYAEAQTILSGVHQNRRIMGGVNGSRLPWQYNLDLRIDKDFAINFKKKNEDLRDRRRQGGLYFNAYLRVENVLNTRNVLAVYGYTGSPDDDAYLTSGNGATTISNQVNPQSFVDLYRIAMLNPNFFGAPRTMTIGLQMNF